MDLKNECKDIHTKKIIPFWNKLRDDENGGFYGFMDNDLNVDKKADKGVILNSRILWFYSSAYRAQQTASFALISHRARCFLLPAVPSVQSVYLQFLRWEDSTAMY